MSLSTMHLPPAWVTQPDKLLKALEFSQYFNSSFNDTTSHLDSSLFCKYITQFLYWKRRLAPSLTPKTVIFSLLGVDGLESLDVMDVILEAQKVCDLTGAFEFYQAANPNFLGISFSNSADATAFTQNFKYYKNTIVAHVLPASEHSKAFSLLWLPPLFELSRVKTLLNKYSKHSTLQHGSIRIGPNKFLRTSTVRGTITIKDNITFEDIPHLIPLPLPHIGHALLIISGREPFCLKCLTKGHLRKDCMFLKCQACNFFHQPSAFCQSLSYAKRVSGTSNIGESYCWPDDVVGEEHHASNASISATTSPTSDGLPLDIDGISHPSISHHTSGSLIDHHIPPSSASIITNTSASFQPQSQQEKCDRTFTISNTLSSPVLHEAVNNISHIATHTTSKNTVSCLANTSSTSNSLTPMGSTEGVSSPEHLNLTLSSASPLATYSRHKHVSKMRITSQSDHLLDAPRSLQIDYKPFQQIFIDAGQQDLLPIAEKHITSLFEDNTDPYHSTDSDDTSNTSMSIDYQDSFILDPASRKRKGSHNSLEEQETSPTALLILTDASPSPAITTTVEISSMESTQNSPDTQTPNNLLITSEHTALIPPLITSASSESQDPPLSLSSDHPKTVAQLASIFSVTTAQASLLFDMCPNQPPTNDNIKCLRLLSSHGIGYSQIIAQPFILKLHYTALHRKVRYLQRSLGAFTINDISHQGRIEDTLDFKGGMVKPSGVFHDD